jgi:plastocyanin
MQRKSIAIIAGCLVAALALAGAAFSRNAKTVTLKGNVGPGYTISVKKAGKSIKGKTLKAGTYKFVISDKSDFHDFTLEREKPSKPDIEKHITGTGFTGSKTMTITLKPGSWRFYCSIHEDLMHGDFKVSN